MPPHILRQRLFDLDATISHHECILLELKQQRSDILSELNLVAYYCSISTESDGFSPSRSLPRWNWSAQHSIRM
ncbi:hypothetical protein B0H12DRAFT_1107302 [Mycena haematopus]|nr:hypothetical protein B0H12DRAFT_1107302 [Mycena haematopus]